VRLSTGIRAVNEFPSDAVNSIPTNVAKFSGLEFNSARSTGDFQIIKNIP
jgi:hypothetical protein